MILESFSYSVSHDLRAPLRAVAGFSGMLLTTLEGKLDSHERRQFEHILDNTKRMNQLIDGLLVLSRVGRENINRTKINMNRLAESVSRQMRNTHPDSVVDFRIGDLPDAIGDERLIWQVFSNLLENAVKFSRERITGIVTIERKTGLKENTYWVKDNGAGLT